MTERIQIIVEATDAASGVLRGITSQFGVLGNLAEDLASPTQNWGNIAATATGLVIDGLKEAVQYTDQYVMSVHELSLASGASLENTSRFVQVLDDYGISAEDAMIATRALTREGLAPSIDTLAKLSDQYLKLNSVEEKNAFVQKNLGRAGLEWTSALARGGDALRAQGAAVQANLIVTEKLYQDTLSYNIAVDDLTDSWHGFQVEVGGAVLPVLADVLTHFQALALADKQLSTEGLQAGSKAWFDRRQVLLEEAKAEIEADRAARAHANGLNEVTDAAGNSVSALQAAATAAAETTKYYQGLIGSIQGMQSETDRYADAQKAADAAQHKAEDDLKHGKITQDEYITILNDNTKALEDNRIAHDKWAAQTVFNFLVAKAAAKDGISDGEGQILIDAGVQLGLFDEATATAMENANHAFDNLDASNATDTIDAVRQALIDLTGHDWMIHLNADASNAMETINQYSTYIPSVHIQDTAGGGIVGNRPHAGGGSWVIPSYYGNEGYMMPGGMSASAGETVTVTPAGAQPGGPINNWYVTVRNDNDLAYITEQVTKRQTQ